MNSEVKQHIKSRETWLRGLHILIFAVFYSIAEIVVATVVLFQFLLTLFTGEKNARLLEFGDNLTTYVYQLLRYLTFNSDTKPFPYDEWPDRSKERTTGGDSGNMIEHT